MKARYDKKAQAVVLNKDCPHMFMLMFEFIAQIQEGHIGLKDKEPWRNNVRVEICNNPFDSTIEVALRSATGHIELQKMERSIEYINANL